MTEEATPRERILAARINISQSKQATKDFTSLIEKNEHGAFNIQSSESYHATEFYNFNSKEPSMLLSRSLLKNLDTNPEQWAAGKKFKRNKTIDMGSLLDAAMLEVAALKEFVFLDESIKNFTTKTAREARDSAYANNQMPILHKDLEILLGSLMQTNMSDDCKDMLKGATTCVSMIGRLEGTPMKGLLDIVPAPDGKYGDGLTDLKRTGMFLPNDFRRNVLNLKYHWQAAIYLDLWNSWCQVMTRPDLMRHKWYFLIVQDSYPFGVGVAQLDPALVDEGREQYKAAIRKANKHLSSGIFPNPYQYGEITTIGFPPKK
ncbi:PD-(D/E)XK nuclease-like domain-containing protein [bacterium]|nr:PD-(D/E)XK nuclease-like domain-containing protein [bacterium]